MDKFISFVFRQRFSIVFFTLIIIVVGSIAWKRLPIDAFPDVTNIQVMILTEAPGLATTDVERLITFPVEIEMNGLPYIRLIRSLSKAGLSQVVIVFEDWVDTYFARQVAFERLQSARQKLPQGINPEMGPISTGLGEIYQYTLESEETDLTELRTIQDWVIRPQLRSLPGVTEVNSFGGFVKQYQVIVDPDELLKYNLTLSQVLVALSNNNANAPANYIIKGAEQIVVRGIGLIRSVEDIQDIVITAYKGIPVYIKNIAEVRIEHEIRWGASTRDGNGETVTGMVVMLKGSNSKEVVDRVKEEVSKIQQRLPSDIKINTFYDRTELIKACIKTISEALLQGGLLVIIVLFIFLGSFRTASIVSLSLPLSALICFIIMKGTGLTANLMSLGGLAIAIGLIADANIVVAENIFRHISSEKESRNIIATCIRATVEVAKPIMFAILIIVLVFVPLFSLQDIEGKMFKPLAKTLMFAMAGSLLISLTITPILGSFFIKPSKEKGDNFAIRLIKKIYLPILHKAITYKKITAFGSLVIFLVTISLFRFIGTEFLPYLDEGSIVLNVVKYPSVSLEESIKIGNMIEKELLKFPEVATVVTKTGRAEIAEDPMGAEQSDVFIMLKPKNSWEAESKKELIKKIEEKLSKIPGSKVNFSQPIALKVNELISGIKSDIAIKVFGYDLDLMREKAEEIEHIISEISGAEDVSVEQISGFLQLEIEIDRKEIARYGINVSDVNEVIETAIGGKVVTTVFEEDRQFGLVVRFSEDRRRDEKTIEKILIPTPEGQAIPLGQLTKIKLVETPNQISRENGMRRIVIECNVRGRDIGSFVAEAKNKIQAIEESLPSGYFIKWGGQFENQQRAMHRLSIVIPVVIFLIFIMLFSSFGSLKPAMLVILNLPFALVGGILAVLIFNINLSVSAVIGFITLFGIAVENGVVLVTFFIQLRRGGLSLKEAVIRGCELRIRPLLLTSLTTMVGLIPLLLTTGPGAEIQKPLAAVILGGLVSSLCLTLIILPTLYCYLEKEDLK